MAEKSRGRVMKPGQKRSMYGLEMPEEFYQMGQVPTTGQEALQSGAGDIGWLLQQMRSGAGYAAQKYPSAPGMGPLNIPNDLVRALLTYLSTLGE